MDMTKEFNDRDSFIHWAIIASLKGVKITDTIKEKPLNITMQINGEEVNPMNILIRLEDTYDSQVKAAAEEMIKELRTEMMEPFEAKVMAIRAHLDALIPTDLDPFKSDSKGIS